MDTGLSLPRELKAVDSATLLTLEQRADDLGLSQCLDAAWVRSNTLPDATHHLWPALWHRLTHRPDLPAHLRCELLITLAGGARVRSLLDVLPADFAPLPRVTSREQGLPVLRLAERAPSVREWQEGQEREGREEKGGERRG